MGVGGDEVSGLLLRSARPHFVLVLAHGAGAGMRHAFLETLCGRLVEHEIATLRYQFPYIEAGRGRPDPPAVAIATVRAAVQQARLLLPGVPLLAGGKSFGGRMTSTAAAEAPLPDVRGIVFFGFPLHPPGKRSTARAAHLADVGVPLLFLQGTRDTFADLELLRPVCADLGERARLHVIEGADHSFHVPRASGRSAADIIAELAATVSDWAAALPG